MLKKITIRARLALVMCFLGVLLIVGGAMGIAGVWMSNGDAKEIYSTQLASSIQLGKTSVLLARTRLGLYRIALEPGSPDVARLTQVVRETIADSKKAWNAYRALPFANADDEQRAAEVNGKLENLAANGIEPAFRAIATGDQAKINEAIVHSQAAALYTDAVAGIDLLGKNQESAAEAAYMAAQTRFRWFVGVAIAGILGGLSAAALAWRSLQRAIGQPLKEALTHFNAIASGDLTTRVEVHALDEMGQLMSGLKAMQGKLVETISVVRDGAYSIDTAAREIAAGNTDLSQRTEDQAASLEETASSMEELTSTVRQNADNAKQATMLASTASETAQRGGEVVGRVVETMHGISESSNRAAAIIGVIEGIAFQTNILALNAAVEAARAGEQGRGFAVVATEVRTLAQRVATAAKEIKVLIGEAVSRIDNGSKLVEEAGGTITAIVHSVKRVNDILAEIASASEEQSAGIEQVNTAVSQMDEVTQQNAALVEEASAAAQSMAQQAQGLREAAAVFRIADTERSASRVMASPGKPRQPAPKVHTPPRAPWTNRKTAPVTTADRRTMVAEGTERDWQTF